MHDETGTSPSTVDRVAAILRVFADAPGPDVGVTEIAQATGLNKSVVHRMLVAMVANGLIAQVAQTRRYRVDLRLWEVGQRFAGDEGAAAVAARALEPVVEKFGATGYVATLDGTEIVYLALVIGSSPFRVHVDIGSRVSAHRTALGKALLARLPDAELERRLAELSADGRIPAGTEAAFAFRDEIARTRVEGVARNKGEHIEGIGSVGVWVARSGSTQLAASVAFPMFSVPDDIWERAEQDLRLVAEQVARQLAQR